MRHSSLSIAIALTLLSACSSPESTRSDLAGASPRREAVAKSVADTRERDDGPGLAAEAMDAMAVAPQVALALAPPAPPTSLASPMVAGGIIALQRANTERYASTPDNPVQRTADASVSTFSIDVDTGSYSNVRRMLVAGQRPPADAVRAEEMLNYFDYGYPAPTSRDTPFRVSTEVAAAPWNNRHQLLQIGIQGYRVAASDVPAANLVFLVDTSGSMQDDDKLPLVKQSLREMVKSLRPQDRLSLVVYAGSAGLVLPPTPGDEQARIIEALDRLEAGGSTNGGEGLQLAYAMARQAFIGKGVNRVILATDGDFNVGTLDQKALETMIADQRKSGIALTTLGFGTGNYNDAMAEQLADIGNGNHAYIDSINEGRKVLVEELSSTMMAIAQDVKIQVEFDPAVVAEYRLIGYENRALRREDFNNDKVDAGEIGAGHDVTALYELTLVGSGGDSVDPLRYARHPVPVATQVGELGWLRLRYKSPSGGSSRLMERALLRGNASSTASPRLRWAAAVSAYADLLRGGTHVGNFGWDQVHALAASTGGADRWGYRAEFLTLVDRARSLTEGQAAVAVSP